MKLPFLVLALCLVLVAGVSGCGGDDATSAETQDSSSATTADSGGNAKTKSTPLDTPPSKVVIGEYEQEGPFAAVSGLEGNKKPSFEPSGGPAPKKVVTRDLEVGSGPAARRGDEVSVYYAGAAYESGQVQFYGWPPNRPATFQLGFSTFGRIWEKSIEGMQVGGLRQVIIPASEFAAGKPVDYVIVLTALQPQSGKS